MRRWMVGILILLLPLAALWATAATLTVNGGVVQAGGTTVDRCDTDGIAISYTVQFLTTPPPAEFKVTTVTISGIDKNCNKSTLMLQLTGPNGAGLLTSPITIQVEKNQSPCTGGPPDPFTCPITLTPPLSAAAVSDVHVVLQKK